MLPQTTRLRYVYSKNPKTIVKFCDSLGKRIEVKQIVFDGSLWFLWFVPDDKKNDVPSGQLKEVKENAK